MVEKLITSFEGLIRRSIAPSVTFIVLALLSDLLYTAWCKCSVWERLQCYRNLVLGGGPHESSAVFIIVLFIVGISYGLGAAQETLYDNFLKKDFDPVLVRGASLRSEAASLKDLRLRVRERIEQEPALTRFQNLAAPSDFVLYEILGGIDTTSTHSYVDTAKATGIFFISLIIVLVGNALLHLDTLGWPRSLLLLALAGACWACGRAATRAQYRARAVRLYVNFLAMPPERLHQLLMKADGGGKPPPPGDKKDA